MLDVENVPGELLILGGTNLCFGSVRVTAAAGNLPFGQLENPADSGNILTISSILVSSQSNTILRWGRTNTALGAAVGSETFRDTRRLLTTNPVARIRQGFQVPVVGGTGVAIVNMREHIAMTDPNSLMVLAPGTLFEIGGETQATDLMVTFYWRERPAEESELSL